MNAAVLQMSQEPPHLPSVVLSVCVHLLLLVILVFGVSWQSRAPAVVSVELWNLPAVPQPERRVEPPPEVKREPEPAPVLKVEPKLVIKPEPAPVLKVEPKLVIKPEAKPAPQPQKVDIAVEKQKKPAPKETPIDLDLSKQMKEQLARELETLARELKTVQHERERSEVLSQFKPAAAPQVPQIDGGYANRIRMKIKPHINVPPDIRGNPEAIYDVEQLPTGEVTSAKLRKTSGHRAYDDAVERAILKASPLPKPERAEQFQRRLELKFRPND